MDGAPPVANQIDLFMHFLGASRDGLVARRVDLDTISSSESSINFGIAFKLGGHIWRWATFIMHKLCGVRTSNYDCFNWKHAMFGERIPKKYYKKITIWHLLWGIKLSDLVPLH